MEVRSRHIDDRLLVEDVGAGVGQLDAQHHGQHGNERRRHRASERAVEASAESRVGGQRDEYRHDQCGVELTPAAAREPQRGRVLEHVLDETEFLSDHGLRALSKYHADHPLDLEVDGITARLDYEPAESTSRLFGGNSNWRGPIWFPVNHLIIEALRVYHRFLDDAWTVEYPRGSGTQMHLGAVADDIARRLTAIFLKDSRGIRPVVAGIELYLRPDLADLIPFHEYFHAENGRGLGASHQTGWTGLVADLLLRHTGGRERDDIASIAQH